MNQEAQAIPVHHDIEVLPHHARKDYKMGYSLYWADQLSADEIDRKSHFRIGNIQMPLLQQTMAAHGMLKRVDAPDWPDPGDFGLPPDVADPRFAEEPPADDREARYRAAVRDVLYGDSGVGAIPSYKLRSNDGWLVTPNEIRAALASASLEHPVDESSNTALEGPNAPEVDPSDLTDYQDPFLNWLVTKLQVRIITPTDEIGRGHLPTRWLNFLRGAAEHGGFFVY